MVHDQGKAPGWLGVTMAILLSGWVFTTTSAAAEFKIARGDRVVFLGATFIERMQDTSYLETELTSRWSGESVTFRNLGWSGDTVAGVSRAVFGKPADGFTRLLRDVKGTRPTVLVVCYGGNEAHRGPSGQAIFVKGVHRLLENLEQLEARIVIISPLAQEKPRPPLPQPTGYNRHLAKYVAALKTIAAERGHHFIATQPIRESTTGALTGNGVHLTDRGYWALAPGIASAMSAPKRAWSVSLEVGKVPGQFRGVAVSSVKLAAGRVAFDAISNQLPHPVPPRSFDQETGCLPAASDVSRRQLRISGLQEGSYQVKVDGAVVVSASAKSLASGVTLDASWEQGQTRRLRELIVAKNKLYFYRYRPQNETYLFLFRKHEQGNNAVEIAQFDPLVAGLEAKIRQAAKPLKHHFDIVRTQP
ncbi:MAG: SGNH/GDSL hydrolase family protein [Pirellulaceae bacterium]